MSKSNYPFLIAACVALALAPFSPEPHLFGKVRWVRGGGGGMTGMDWFALVQHGVPALMIPVLLYLYLRSPKSVDKKERYWSSEVLAFQKAEEGVFINKFDGFSCVLKCESLFHFTCYLFPCWYSLHEVVGGIGNTSRAFAA